MFKEQHSVKRFEVPTGKLPSYHCPKKSTTLHELQPHNPLLPPPLSCAKLETASSLQNINFISAQRIALAIKQHGTSPIPIVRTPGFFLKAKSLLFKKGLKTSKVVAILVVTKAREWHRSKEAL